MRMACFFDIANSAVSDPRFSPGPVPLVKESAQHGVGLHDTYYDVPEHQVHKKAL